MHVFGEICITLFPPFAQNVKHNVSQLKTLYLPKVDTQEQV